MSLITLVGIAFVMSLDSLAASLALGAANWRQKALPVALCFGLLGGLAPLVGLWLGERLSAHLTAVAGWIGVALLAAIGLYFVFSALRTKAVEPSGANEVLRAGKIALLALSLSVDNLLIAFGLGLRGAATYTLAGLSAAMIFSSSYLGLMLGDAARQAWERRASVAAGVLLVGLAILLLPRA